MKQEKKNKTGPYTKKGSSKDRFVHRMCQVIAIVDLLVPPHSAYIKISDRRAALPFV